MGTSDDALSDWEAEISSSDHEAEKVSPKAVRVQSSKKVDVNKGKSSIAEFQIPSHLAKPRLDPAAERERIRAIEELRDVALSGDIFGVDANPEGHDVKARARQLLGQTSYSKNDAKSHNADVVEGTILEQIALNRLAEVEHLCDILTSKIMSSSAKSKVWMKFLDRMIAACSDKMDPEDLKTVEKKAATARKQQTVAKNERLTTARKVNRGDPSKVNFKNFQDELDLFDGVGEKDSSDEQGEGVEDEIEIDPEYADFM